MENSIIVVAVDDKWNENNGAYQVAYLWDGESVTTAGGMYCNEVYSVNCNDEQFEAAKAWQIENTERSIPRNKYCYNMLGASKEFMCPVVMLLQLNRGNTNRVDKRPLASDSRESGAIEQDVDGWIGLYRDSAFDENSKWKNITEIIVRLHRHGDTGTCYQVLTGHGFEDADEHTVAKLLHDEETKKPTKATTTDNF